VVLPTLWCYCDKFWHRLDKCAIPSAASSQPLPFVCPLDHVVDPAFLHGSPRARSARAARGMLAARVDGPWEEGLPFRGRYWLQQLGAHPRIGLSRASLGSKPHAATEHAYATMPELLAATRAAPPSVDTIHTFVPGTDGPHLQLPSGRTDVQLRAALAAYEHVRLLRVTLTEARALLSCYVEPHDAASMRQLSNMLFQHEWCYRPAEMTAEWSAVERRGKPKRRSEPWCVWGFTQPEVPPLCPGSGAHT